MKPIFEVHPIQGKILKVLLFQTTARFSDLNPDKIPTDHFSFHLKSLLESELLKKLPGGQYGLTAKGKEFANRFDTEKIIIERQAKLSVAVVPVKKVGKKKYYLIHQRLKQPYFGYYGVVNGKIRWGEKVFETGARELLEETGLKASKMTLVGIFHKSDFSINGDLLEDKYFFRIRVDKFSGKLRANVPEGKNFWFTKDKLLKLSHLFPDLEEFIDHYDQNDLLFDERSYVAQGY